jgi:hypothetical protein
LSAFSAAWAPEGGDKAIGVVPEVVPQIVFRNKVRG